MVTMSRGEAAASLQALVPQRKDWFLPLLGTAASIAFAATLSSALRILRGFARARVAAFDPPQAILVLGGDKERELLAAKFAASCGEKSITRLVKPQVHAAGLRLLPVYVSSGFDDAAAVMLHAGVHSSRVRIDNRALDTVTNFTTMLTTFLKAEYTHVYVVTSDYHMPRAKMIATLVLCSHGIAFTSVVLPSRGQGQAAGVRREDGKENRRDDLRISSRYGRRLESNANTAALSSPSQGQALVEANEDSSSDTSEPSGPEKLREGKTVITPSEGVSASLRTGLPRPSFLSRESVLGPDGSSTSALSSSVEPETWVRFQRDRLRTALWLMTGWHGAELLRFTRPTRYRLHKQKPAFPKAVSKQD